MLEKLKSLFENDQFFYSCLVVLVGVISFGLGRLTVVPEETAPKPQVVFYDNKATSEAGRTTTTKAKPEVVDTTELIIASKSGTKYHLSTCPGAKQIITENKVTFSSRTEAEAAGYKPAANCPGLQ